MTFRVVIVDCGSRKVGDIADQLAALGAVPRVVALEAVAEETLGARQALVVSGGPRLFTEEPELIERFAFLDAEAGPILGICLGHQALGLRDGARVFLGEARRGDETLELVEAHALMSDLGPQPLVRADHCEGIDLPPKWRCLARSAHYAVEAMVHRTRPRVGVQFHPEVSVATGGIFLRNFVAWAAGWGESR